MELKMQFGQYHVHPKDTEPKLIEVPDDTIFITGGVQDIGNAKHDGALHLLCFTKADDKTVDNIKKADVLRTYNQWRRDVFRINGWAVFSFSDVYMDEWPEFIDADFLNEIILELTTKPKYFVHLVNGNNVDEISRLNYIKSKYKACISSVRRTDVFTGMRPVQLIKPNEDVYLSSITTCHHNDSVIMVPDDEYGKELFNEILYTNLSAIYPEFNERILGYDFDYISDTNKEVWGIEYPEFKVGDGEWTTIDTPMRISFRDITDYLSFEKRLPIKQKTMELSSRKIKCADTMVSLKKSSEGAMPFVPLRNVFKEN